MKKLALALMATAAAVLGVGIVADAYPPEKQVTASNSNPGPGEPFTASANCVAPETATFTLDGTDTVATCVPGAAATFALIAAAAPDQATATLTAPTTPGTYLITVVGSASGDLGSTTIVVSAAPAATTPTGGLPATGSSGISLTTGLAIGLLTVGLMLFAVATVRRRQPTAA